ncbi:MAG: hypothetical protein WCE68_14170 [Anaerolineales bacterium]
MDNDLDLSFLDENVFEPLRSQGHLNAKAFRTLAWTDKTPETNWIRVQYAYELMRDNLHGASVFPGAVAAIIRSRAWEGYEFRGKVLQATSFQAFVEAKPPQGLGTTVDDLINLCKKYPAVVDGIDQVLRNERGKVVDRGGEGFKENVAHFEKKASKANSFQHSLRRLRTLAEADPKARSLREQVLRGEISANHALRELGKRNARYGVDASPESVVAFAKKHLNKSEIRKVIEALKE